MLRSKSGPLYTLDMSRNSRGRPLNAPPGFIHPCRPIVAKRPPGGPNWVHELKHDGYRLQIHVRDGRVRLYTMNAADWTRRYPRIVEHAARIKGSAIIDAEVVWLDGEGVAQFDALYSRVMDHAAIACAFDLLMLDGDDLRRRPLSERKAALRKLLRRSKGGIQYVELSVDLLSTDVHSGIGGSIFPNAAWRLVWALNSLKDKDEHILIPGFYDNIRPPSARDRELLSKLPDPAGDYRTRFGVPYFLKGLKGGVDLEVEGVFSPTCTICFSRVPTKFCRYRPIRASAHVAPAAFAASSAAARSSLTGSSSNDSTPRG